MATTGSQEPQSLIAIAPAPNDGANRSIVQGPLAPQTCQACARRKVKCDKALPVCSSCRKTRIECTYHIPPTRRKRKPDSDVLEKLARYERILREHDLLDHISSSNNSGLGLNDPIFLHWNNDGISESKSNPADRSKSNYISSNIWRNLGGDVMQCISDSEGHGNEQLLDNTGRISQDPLTGAFLDSEQSRFEYHPDYATAMLLWKAYIENVEPICKIVHMPTTEKIIETASRKQEFATKSEQCLAFAVYHFAVVSMTGADCFEKFGQRRELLVQQYNAATRQALVNASFLRTTDLSILQALVLFLLACRDSYDSNTFWILTGVAVRIAQRMGLHRDGEELGLAPFDIQMRRRLFYQLLPLDGTASQMAGAGIKVAPEVWNTKMPLNINDNQIWPNMSELPLEHSRATEMIFYLSRLSTGQLIAKSRGIIGGRSVQNADTQEAELYIDRAERKLEEKYIRYCDVADPLHFLTVVLCRSGIATMRLRVGLSRIKNQTATDFERKTTFELALKIVDNDSSVYAHSELVRKYRWYVRPFFVWGMWDSLTLLLMTLWKRGDLLSHEETVMTWTKLERVFKNHKELIENERALYVAFGKAALRAWDANALSNELPEPAFIVHLRPQRKGIKGGKQDQSGDERGNDAQTTTAMTMDSLLESDASQLFDAGSQDMTLVAGDSFDLEGSDWAFWDQLIQNNQI
ncbi:C6 transcription factor domain-containing protein [Penicillium macrosclerotiorum]|uniref:C6 transcription factor domain-containing protein n=1 Tax=Penicillium macrosclerotiorum TaxID=303699 RepID=UPI002548510E|nr:C6 transcription factor domain-containing protein [Penicillium macrosclerotiorum]KAJ5692472.1 C6 transcription factor domain-containing protein [Penicillium macrosclerotiorum]